MMNESVDYYFINGCGRCALYASDQCKARQWKEELAALRAILQGSELLETCKWGQPCYTYQGKNVLLIAAFKSYCSISFFKGILLNNDHQLLQAPGPNSQAVRSYKFSNIEDIKAAAPYLLLSIQEAIEIEKEGRKPDLNRNEEAIPIELEEKLAADPVLSAAFYQLTPGRQRSYLLYIAQAKQSKTRLSRIEKSIPKIMAGLGHNEYKKP